MAGEARQQLDGFVAQARDEVGEQARQRSAQVATQLRTLSRQLTALAEGRPEGAGRLSGYVHAADERVRRLAGRLEQGGPEGVVDDVTRFARRRPGVFLAGALGAGFVVGRVARAGASASRSNVGQGGGPGGGGSGSALSLPPGGLGVGDDVVLAPGSTPMELGSSPLPERNPDLAS